MVMMLGDKGGPDQRVLSHKCVILSAVCSALSWATFQSTVQILTFRQLHDMPTPTALQRSGWGPSACCPAALPCSAGFDDGSGWPLRMVLPRQRTTECHSDLTAHAAHEDITLPSLQLLGHWRDLTKSTARDCRLPQKTLLPTLYISGTICWDSQFHEYYWDATQK